MVEARDGLTWAEGFARFPALLAVVRDDGIGLGKGVRLEQARRRAAGLPSLDDTLYSGPRKLDHPVNYTAFCQK